MTSTRRAEPAGDDLDRKGAAFWVAVAIAWPVIGYSVWKMYDARFVEPWDAVRWAVGALLVHDLVWLPTAGGLAFVGARVVPPRARIPVGWAVATTLMLAAVGWPFYRRYGARSNDPSLLPRDYGEGVAVYVAIVLFVGAAWAGARWWRGRAGRTGGDGAALDAASAEPGDPAL